MNGSRLVIGLFLLAPAVGAQVLYSDLGKPSLGDGNSMSASLLVDVDGDRDLDIVLARVKANWNSGVGEDRLFLNNGDGTFSDATSSWMPPTAFRSVTEVIAAGDLDGDGDQDLVSASTAGQAAFLYLNAGGRFVHSWGGAIGTAPHRYTHDLVVFDADGDADLDLLHLSTQRSTMLANDGRASFTDVTESSLPGLSGRFVISGFAGDIDRDGDLDLLLAGWDAAVVPEIYVFTNDGRGRFRDETALRMSGVATRGWLGVADIDGDLDLDVYLSDWTNGRHQLFENDGSGRFRDVTAGRLPSVSIPVSRADFVDADDDGDQDLLALPWDPILGTFAALYLNDGSGTFIDSTQLLPSLVFATYGLAIGDLDGDGDQDFVMPRFSGGPTFVQWNLSRQVAIDRQPSRIGQALTYEAFGTPGFRRVAVPWISLGRRSSPVVVPGLGSFWLDSATLATGPALMLNASTGYASFTVPIPYDFRLVGRRVYAQAGFQQGPRIRLSGLAAGRIGPPRY